MARPRDIYVFAMCVAGVLLAAFTLNYPGVLSDYATGFGVMLAVSFLIDIVLMRFSSRDEVMALSMEARFGGFLAGMLLYLGVTFLFGANAP